MKIFDPPVDYFQPLEDNKEEFCMTDEVYFLIKATAKMFGIEFKGVRL